MELEGKVIAVLPAQSGTSKSGNAWMSQEYVIETADQYPKKCCFRVFGEDKIKEFAIKQGEQLKVLFDINAREFKGRWYNDISAWKVERTYADQAAPLPEGDALEAKIAAKFGAVPENNNDSLPF